MWGDPGSWPCSSTCPHTPALAVFCPREEWCVLSARAIATVIRSCLSHERSRRCRRRCAAPATGCSLRSIRKGDANKGTLGIDSLFIVVVVVVCCFHFLSFSFIFFHLPSFAFIFFHFLSFSFIFFHVLSCSFMFFHVLSRSFIFFHVLSFSFIFFHFLSFSFIFNHFLSFSIIFYHFLRFSLSLFCAQNLIFFWASISLRFLLTVLM